jgi:hypothetical protein
MIRPWLQVVQQAVRESRKVRHTQCLEISYFILRTDSLEVVGL